MKVCRKCGREKPLSEFNRDRRASDGRYSWCRECTRADQRQRRKADPEHARAQRREAARRMHEKRRAQRPPDYMERARARQSEKIKAYWQDPAWRARQIAALQRGWDKRRAG